MKKTVLAAAALAVPLLGLTPQAWAHTPFSSDMASEWQENEHPLTMQEVPYHVIRAARRAAGNRPLLSVALDDGAEYEAYEFTVDRYDRKNMKVVIRYDGTLAEVATEISLKDVPKVVVAALTREVPEFELNYIEKSVRPRKGTFYLFEGMALDASSPITVEINAKGTEVNISRDPTEGLAMKDLKSF